MAKKKAAAKKVALAKKSAAKPKPAKKAAKKKAPAKKAAAKTPSSAASAPAKSSASAGKSSKSGGKAPPLSTEQIGHAAGAVWQALEGSGPVTIAALKKSTGLTGDLAMAGVGWLAREDKLLFEASGRSMKVQLR